MSDDRPDCARCRHYFVTHEASFPHGCRAFGIKAKRPPSIQVEEASGKPCEAFERRPERAPGTRRA